MFLTEISDRFFVPAVLSLFLVCSFFSLTYRGIIRTSNYIRLSSIMITVMYLLTLINLANTPFPSSVYYVTLIMSVPLLFSLHDIFFQNDENSSLVFVLVAFIGLTFNYFSNFQSNYLQDMLNQNSSSYSLLYFMPFILCIKKNWIKIAGLFIVFIALLTTMKRGGIIAFTIGLFAYYLFVMMKNHGSIKKMYRFIITAVVVVVGLSFVFNYFDSITDNAITSRFDNIQSDEGSGRLETWQWVYNQLASSSLSEIIFGHGWNSVFYQSGIRSAHNDFLEVLYDFGVITFVLYILLYKALFKTSVCLLKEGSSFAAPMFSSTIILLVNSFVSHVVFYPRYLIIYCMFWAYIDSRTHKTNN